MAKEFEDAAFGGQKGSIIGPVETSFGFHIIEIVNKSETTKVKRQELVLEKKPEKPLNGWVDTGLTGKQFTHASASPNTNGIGYVVNIQFNAEGQKLFTDLTKKNLNKPIGIFLDEQEIKLTPKQYDILRLLVDNKNNLVSREKFMKEVWGHSDVTPRNVDSQINYLKKKIEGFQGQITAVPSHGYRLEA